MRDRLLDLCREAQAKYLEEEPPVGDFGAYLADHLLAKGMIVPPCKVGDNLYVISQMKDKRILPFINTYKVTSVSIRKNGFVVYHEMDGYIKIFKQSDFGKTVFLTKAEAEKFMIDTKDGVK